MYGMYVCMYVCTSSMCANITGPNEYGIEKGKNVCVSVCVSISEYSVGFNQFFTIECSNYSVATNTKKNS